MSGSRIGPRFQVNATILQIGNLTRRKNIGAVPKQPAGSGDRDLLRFVIGLVCDRWLGRSLVPVHKGFDCVLKHGTEILGIMAIRHIGFLVLSSIESQQMAESPRHSLKPFLWRYTEPLQGKPVHASHLVAKNEETENLRRVKCSLQKYVGKRRPFWRTDWEQVQANG
jgi:hypothetical protein